MFCAASFQHFLSSSWQLYVNGHKEVAVFLMLLFPIWNFTVLQHTVSVQKWKMLVQIWCHGGKFGAHLYSIPIDNSRMGEGKVKGCLPLPALPTRCVSYSIRYCQSRIRNSSPTWVSWEAFYGKVHHKTSYRWRDVLRCPACTSLPKWRCALEIFAEETEMPWGCVSYRGGLPQVLVISNNGHVSLKLSVPVLFVNASLSISLIVLSFLFVLFCCLWP